MNLRRSAQWTARAWCAALALLLADANRLRAAARGEERVVVPTLRFSDPAAQE